MVSEPNTSQTQTARHAHNGCEQCASSASIQTDLLAVLESLTLEVAGNQLVTGVHHIGAALDNAVAAIQKARGEG